MGAGLIPVFYVLVAIGIQLKVIWLSAVGVLAFITINSTSFTPVTFYLLTNIVPAELCWVTWTVNNILGFIITQFFPLISSERNLGMLNTFYVLSAVNLVFFFTSYFIIKDTSKCKNPKEIMDIYGGETSFNIDDRLNSNKYDQDQEMGEDNLDKKSFY